MGRTDVVIEKPLVLDVGSGEGSVAGVIFEDVTVVRMDIDPELNPDYVHDITKPLPLDLRDKFDIVYLSHVLEHLPYKQVLPTLKNLYQALKPGTGEMWVIVPALEWAAKEIAKDQPSPVLMGFLYGSQSNEWQYHKCGFTLNQLRLLMESTGMYTRRAHQSAFIITLDAPDGTSKEFPSTQNIVVGLRSE